MNQDSELDAFKREIDMRQFALSLGYEMDRRESWRGSTVLKRGPDKIVVKRNGNSHYVFFSVRDDSDNGTIIDFLQRRKNLSLGAVRRILRPWIGRSVTPPQLPRLEPTSPDRMRVESTYRCMANASRHPYLEHERCLPASLLSSTRFAGRVRIDRGGNAVFPHFDATGLCGYEIKNHRFTGFMPCYSRTPMTKPVMPAWVANLTPNSRGWSRRPSPGCRRKPKSWRRSMLMKRGTCW